MSEATSERVLDYDALLYRLNNPNNWCGDGPIAGSYPPTWWGNSDAEFGEYREGEAGPAPGTDGLPAPLRTPHDGGEDAEADAELEGRMCRSLKSRFRNC